MGVDSRRYCHYVPDAVSAWLDERCSRRRRSRTYASLPKNVGQTRFVGEHRVTDRQHQLLRHALGAGDNHPDTGNDRFNANAIFVPRTIPPTRAIPLTRFSQRSPFPRSTVVRERGHVLELLFYAFPSHVVSFKNNRVSPYWWPVLHHVLLIIVYCCIHIYNSFCLTNYVFMFGKLKCHRKHFMLKVKYSLLQFSE